MGLLGKFFKGPEIDMEKSNANAQKMRVLFDQVVENGADYRLIFGCGLVQLRFRPRQQNKDRQPYRRLERS